MKELLACLLLIACLTSCKSKKKKTNDATYFSVSSFVLGQVRQLDTAHVRFTRIVNANGRSDTAAMAPGELRAAAADFLGLPDISTPEHKDSYDEMNTFDESLNSSILTYTANTPDVPVRTETVLLEPTPSGDAFPMTVLVNRVDQKDSNVVIKDLTWHVGKRFQVVTKTSHAGGPDEVRTVIVLWE